MNNIAIIVAAGQGRRFGNEKPKQYLNLGNKKLVEYSIEAFQNHKLISDVILVVDKGHDSFYQDIVEKHKIKHVVFGGNKRQVSVYNALKYAKKINPKNVLIHDAARPFIGERIISESIKNLSQFDAVIPTINVEDTLKKINKKSSLITINRKDLKRAQTPQSFDYNILSEAYEKIDFQDLTDDASIFETLGLKIVTIKGSQLNFKITEQDDLERANKMLEASKIYRTGIGYDIHKFAEEGEETEIVIGGIKILHNKALIAHSDGDVLIHALVDAILGALALGDIGEHFSDSDPKYKNMDSKNFLIKAKELCEERAAEIVNIDSILLLEKPKVSKYKTEIRKNIASILELDINQISVKATTSEKLGFIGREEGIAAQVIINLKLDK